MEENITIIDETVIEASGDVLEGNTVEDTTCTICESIDYTEQLNAIYESVYVSTVFIVIYVSIYLFNYIVSKFVIKREA